MKKPVDSHRIASQPAGNALGVSRVRIDLGSLVLADHLSCAMREGLLGGDLRSALENFEKSYPLFEACDSELAATHYFLAAAMHQVLGNLELAMEIIDRALDFLSESQNLKLYAEALLVRGTIDYTRAERNSSLRYFQAAQHIFDFRLNDLAGVCRASNSIGIAHKSRGRWSSAVEAFEQAIALGGADSSAQFVEEIVRASFNLAVVQTRLGKLGIARRLLERVIEQSETSGFEKILRSATLMVSEHERVTGDLKSASAGIQSVRSWAQEHGHARTEGLCHEYLADVRADQGRPDAAIRHLGRALSLALEKFPETDMVCEAQRRRAEVLVQLGRGAEAREAAEEALRVSSKIAEPYEIGLAHRALGVVLAHEGDGEAALRELARCEEILAELGEKFERARTLLQRGRLLKSTGAAGEAAEALERARQIFTEMELPNWVERVDELLLERELPEAPHLLTGRPLNTPDRFGIITRDPRMLALWQDLTRAAATKLPVLIEGESGTGKELFAQAVHQLSPRQGKEFVPINCGAIPHDMQESELFGHARGSFTGSVDDRPGLFETAHGGTLFLDEIGEMAPTAQVKLLRALETGQVRRIGDRGQRTVDVRYVAATNVGIQAAVAAGRFREDLFHRLDGFAMTIPPLRERRADIPLLVDFFVGRAARENDRDVRVGPALMNRLMAYDWRGNVRELRNKVTRAVMLAGRPGELSVADFPFLLNAGGAAPVTIDQDMDQIERARILKALEETNWSKSAAARLLNVQRTTLHSRMERLGIPIRKPGGRERAH